MEKQNLSFEKKVLSIKDLTIITGRNQFFSSSILRDIRFIIDFLKKTTIIKMYYNRELVGYCLLVRGGGRHRFSRKDDYIIEPYVVSRSMRGNGFGNCLISYISSFRFTNCRMIYAVVQKTNAASAHILENNGFEFDGQLRKKKYIFDRDANGDCLLYKLVLDEMYRR